MLPIGGGTVGDAVGCGGAVAVGWAARVAVGGGDEVTVVVVGEAWAMVGAVAIVGVGDAVEAVGDGSAVSLAGGCGGDGAG